MEKEIVNLVEKKGPLTGSEIIDAFSCDDLLLWKSCMHSEDLMIQRLGTRYLRLDRRVNGFARLSPSILREFLTYSVVGLASDPNAVAHRAREITSNIRKISKYKFDLVYGIVSGIVSRFESERILGHQFCFIIAGDIVYNMAHDVPRPERSTDKMVNGSDIDLIVILDNHVPEDLMKKLDDAIYQEKYRILITPSVREEIDYIVKKLERVKEQVAFDTFKHMVACKILQEGILLYGSKDLFNTTKALLREHGINEKLHNIEKMAEVFRKDAEDYLFREPPDKLNGEDLYLFYTTEESEEFE